jgi:bifunctional DNA-binding transcriptional regulator/antitoxin component of YhaV-PrlF toxin-antitoxin module
MKLETVASTKGQTTIPDALRKELGIGVGTILGWQVHEGKLVGTKKAAAQTAVQQHIRKYSGTWKGVSKVLKMTRP